MSSALETAILNGAWDFAIVRCVTDCLFFMAASFVIIYKLFWQKTSWLTWLMIYLLWFNYVFDIIRDILFF